MKITFKSISGVKGEDKPEISEVAQDKCDNLENDFDYVLSGIDKLCREGMYKEAIEIIDAVSHTLDQAVTAIGNNFTSETIESTLFNDEL